MTEALVFFSLFFSGFVIGHFNAWRLDDKWDAENARKYGKTK